MKFLSLLTLSAGLVGCSLPTKKIHTEIEINADRERVWKILADNKSYPEWNPYHVKVDGKLVEGEVIVVKIHKPNGEKVEIEPHVIEVKKPELLVWGGGLSGVFTGAHVFELEAISSNKTKLIHREKFEGIAIPFASLEAIEEGYNIMNRALKKRAEENQASNL